MILGRAVQLILLAEKYNQHRLNPAIGVQASRTLCRCQARVNGEASQNTQSHIPLKRGFYLLLFPSSYSYFKFFVLFMLESLERRLNCNYSFRGNHVRNEGNRLLKCNYPFLTRLRHQNAMN